MMGSYTRLCSSILFPAHELAKGHDSVRRRRRLEQSQWWEPDRLRIHQLARLKQFLAEIGGKVPYYRQLFDRLGFDGNAMGRVEDLSSLPVLTKAEIRKNLESMKARGASGLKKYNTGGSSGEPLVFYTSSARRSHDVAAKWRATRWWGVDIGDPELVVWGSPIELGVQDRARVLRDWIFRSRLLPAFDMSEAGLDRYVASIRSSRPKMLFGYPSSLAFIAAHAGRRGVDLANLGIRVAFVTSERLYDHQRAAIETAFGCPVANGYGGRDAGFIAHECPQGRMHLSAEDIVVEIVDAHGKGLPPGHSGEIVVTHLATADFPFVRYATGDRASLDTEPCACGRGLPVLKQIEGRSTDFVVASDGTVMHGLVLIYVLRDMPQIERFKIVQHDLHRIQVLIVPAEGYGPAIENRIRAEFRRRLGADTEVLVSQVQEIDREASGKYRYVVSHASAAIGTEGSLALKSRESIGA